MRQTAVSRDRETAALLERSIELVALHEVVHTAQRGRGTTVIVEGPPGIGKTGLLRAVVSQGTEAGLNVAVARGAALERDFAFGVVRQLLDPVLKAIEPEARLAYLTGPAASAAPLFPRWSGDLGPPSRPVPGRPEDIAADRVHLVLHGLYCLVAEVAGSSPLLLAVDDVHLADTSSLRFLAFLAQRLHELPVAVVLATRGAGNWNTAELRRALVLDPDVLRIGPRALSETAVAELAEQVLGRPVGRAFAVECHRVTGGNPFYLHELLRSVIDGGFPLEDASSSLRGLGPEAVAASVEARFDQLPDGAADLARSVAILGDGTQLFLVAALAGMPLPQASEVADALRAAAVLAPNGPPTFAHPILRTVVYEGMAPGERAIRHRRAAGLLRGRGAVPATIAAQLLLAEPETEPWAVETCRAAAQEALSRGAPEEATVYLLQALAEVGGGSERAHVLLELGSAEALVRAPGAGDHLTEAIALACDPDVRLLATLALWGVNDFEGQAGAWLQLLRDTAAASSDGDPALVLRLQLELARGARSCIPTAAEGIARIAALPDQLREADPDLRSVGLGLIAYDAMLANRPVKEVLSLVEQALPLSDVLLEHSESPLPQLPLHTLIWCDALTRAAGVLDELIFESRRRGAAIGEVVGHLWRLLVACRAGALVRAEADGADVLTGARTHGWRFGQAIAQIWLAGVALERGDVDGAGRLHRGVAALMGSSVGTEGWVDHARHGRAIWLLAAGEREEALEELLAVGRRHDQWQVTCPSELPWRSDAALAAAALGDTALAGRLAGDEIALARAFGAPRALGVALRAHGVVTGDEESLAEAVRVLAGSPARLEYARALTDHGALLRGRGSTSAARLALRQGLAVATDCGAVALADRARAELVRSGARPRRVATEGAAALTASELRVVHLAAHGASNPEIAASLYLGRKTVETHLSNAYRKLGITSRSDLAGAVGTRSGPAAEKESTIRSPD